MSAITVTPIREIKLDLTKVPAQKADLAWHAIAIFGYLIKTRPVRDYSWAEFADLIEGAYSITNKKTATLVRDLRSFTFAA